MSAHTPGPWEMKRLIDNSGKPYSTLYEAHIDITPCMIWAPIGNAEQEANARLISAAPELLEALETAAEWMESLRASGDAGYWNWSEGDQYSKALAAIAKAKGETT